MIRKCYVGNKKGKKSKLYSNVIYPIKKKFNVNLSLEIVLQNSVPTHIFTIYLSHSLSYLPFSSFWSSINHIPCE